MRYYLDQLVSTCAYADPNTEKIPAERQRLIYSGRVMKDPDQLSTYKIKDGNTIHMVKSAPSNAQQNPASANTPSSSGAPRAAAGVPQNMAAGTANNPLAGLTGARYAGHMGLPGMEMFGADGGMGAPPSEEQMASMMDDPNTQQMLNEALSNPAMVDMIIQNTPQLRNNPQARQMLNSPEFRRMMTDPAIIRQSQQMRRMMQGGAGGAGSFPAPGVTDTTPAGAAGSNPTNQPGQAPLFNPFAMGPGAFGSGAAAGTNPFAAMFGQPSGATPAQTPPPAPGSAGQGTPSQASPPAADANTVNPFASMFGGGGAAAGGAGGFQMPPVTPEMMQQAMQMFGGGGVGGGFGDLFGAGAGAAANPAAPADTRPPEERYADQLRQLNDMGFFDFDRNVEALRRSGGSVQGAIEQLLNS